MTKIMGPSAGYTDLIDFAMQQNDEPRTAFPLRPSAAGDCQRKLAYDLMQYRGHAKYQMEKPDPTLKRVFALGHAIEWQSIKNFQLLPKLNPDIQVKYQQQVVTLFNLDPIGGKKQEMVEGSLDFAMFLSKEGGIGDVKSAKDKFSAHFSTKWDQMINDLHEMESTVEISETAVWVPNLREFIKELNDPFFEKNFVQLNLYCCSSFARERNVTHGFIYRYCKNDSRHFEIRFKPDPTMLDAFQAKCNRVNAAVAKKKPADVDRDHALGSISCGVCPYRELCWSGKDAKKEYFNTLPKKKWPTDIKAKSSLGKMVAALEQAQATAAAAEQLEQAVVKEMVNQKLYKIRTEAGHIYITRKLKSGGKGGGGRVVLRRTKL